MEAEPPTRSTEQVRRLTFDDAMAEARLLADRYGEQLGNCLFADDGESDGIVWTMGFVAAEQPDWCLHFVVTGFKSSMIAMHHLPPQETLPASRKIGC